MIFTPPQIPSQLAPLRAEKKWKKKMEKKKKEKENRWKERRKQSGGFFKRVPQSVK